MTLDEARDELLRSLKQEAKNIAYREGYIDGVLDIYNKLKEKELINA